MEKTEWACTRSAKSDPHIMFNGNCVDIVAKNNVSMCAHALKEQRLGPKLTVFVIMCSLFDVKMKNIAILLWWSFFFLSCLLLVSFKILL